MNRDTIRALAALSRAATALTSTVRGVAVDTVAERYLNQCDSVGERAQLRGRPHVENFGRIEIGHRLRMSSLGVQSHLVSGPRGTLEIGNDVSIDFGVGIAAHAHVSIGDRTQIGPFAMILDTDFHEVGNHDVSPAGDAIRIGEDVRLAPRVTVLKGSTIGAGASIMAGSVVTGEIPPGAVAGGVPARVLRQPVGAARVEADSPSNSSPAERVCRVLKTTFSLRDEPQLSNHPRDISGWDSLGTLKLILALEDEFQISVNQDDMLGIQSVQALVEAIHARIHGAR